ncbi:MAG: hypothetical protein NTY19_44870 [Planctomycetota bacterium]|nr:hypothetical protein [Planctomycetota bacterium]
MRFLCSLAAKKFAQKSKKSGNSSAATYRVGGAVRRLRRTVARGNRQHLSLRLLGFLCSAKYPGNLILDTYDLTPQGLVGTWQPSQVERNFPHGWQSQSTDEF